MAGNTFGTVFKLTTFGESHGKAMGGILDGCPAGLALDFGAIQEDMARRRPGQSSLTTARSEADQLEWLSGTVQTDEGVVTTGAPLAFTVANTAARPADYDHLKDTFRPSHADFTYEAKYGLRDVRGGGRASARETVSRVAGGAVARQLLATMGVEVGAYVERVQDISMPLPPSFHNRDEVDAHPVRCPHPETAERMADRIADVKKAGDTVGGALVLVARGVPAGWGEPVFDRLHADLAKAMMSINAVKAVEVGDGFAVVEQRGEQHRDEMTPKGFLSNHAGGVLGGITSGQTVAVSMALKPTSSILIPGKSIDLDGQPAEVVTKGRHDPCVGIRATPIAEAMLALVLMDHYLRHRAQCGDVAPTTPVIPARAGE
ncbi:MAG: chorismate synthase [Halioglobus sp.]